MALSVTVGLLVLASALLVWWIKESIRIARFKKLHGCKAEVPIQQSERIIGYGLYKIQIQASKDRNILDVGRQRYLDYGNTWSAYMMGKKFYNTIDPENIRHILATNFKDFGIGGRQEALGALLGQGIFTTDGAQWEHSRALIRPNFTRAQVADLDALESHIQHLISRIPRDGSTVDLQPLFFELTLDAVTEFLFGESVSSLSNAEVTDEFGEAFDLAQRRLGNRTRLGKWIRLCRDTEFDTACKTVHEFVDRIVFKALEKSQPKDAEKSIDGKTGAERYLFLTEMIKSTRDPKQLRDELLNILLAGRDTTASLLSNTFHVLARRQDIWANLKEEVDRLEGEKPNYETLRNMKYLKYLLKESLRLYPVVPSNARFAVRDTLIPRGGGPDQLSAVFIPKGGIVAYSVYSMHRRRDIYGPDAELFRPERWGPEENLRPGWAYLPFNGGPRICVGQQFALTEASYTIVRLLQEFSGIEDRDGEEWMEQLSLTCCSAMGVRVALAPRR